MNDDNPKVNNITDISVKRSSLNSNQKELIIYRNGIPYVCKYDESDHELISKHKWSYQNGYLRTTINKKCVLMHRLILGLTDPKIWTDHANHNKLDNRRSNIRACTPAQNQWNRKNIKKPGFKGIHRSQGIWEAKIKKDGEVFRLGHYHSDKVAASVYDTAAKILFGEFAYPNLSEVASNPIQLEIPLKSRVGHPFTRYRRV